MFDSLLIVTDITLPQWPGCLNTTVDHQIIAEEANVWPNPAQDVLFLELHNGITSVSFEIFDTMGRSIIIGTTKDQIDVSSLRSGIYTLNISTGNTWLTWYRFIKE